MWHRKAIEVFLGKEKVDPATVEAIKARLDKVVQEDGIFGAHQLDEVMDSPVLVRKFEAAWERDPDLLRAGFENR